MEKKLRSYMTLSYNQQVSRAPNMRLPKGSSKIANFPLTSSRYRSIWIRVRHDRRRHAYSHLPQIKVVEIPLFIFFKRSISTSFNIRTKGPSPLSITKYNKIQIDTVNLYGSAFETYAFLYITENGEYPPSGSFIMFSSYFQYFSL